MAKRLIQDPELEEQFDDLVLACPDKLPLIDEGNYDAIVLTGRRERRFRRELLAFKFRIVSQGTAFGVVVPGYCNLDFGRSPGRKLPERSKLAVWLRLINAFDPEVSYKRVHLTTFGKFQFIVRVATSRGTAEHPLPTNEHYSQVTELLEVVGRITSRGSGV
jgi:hypothetical protein